MKRRAEFLVEKRDGRREWLRATKLARSIHLALLAIGAGEAWRAADLADTVLSALRKRSALRGDTDSLTTIEIADAVQQVLIATGFAGAAWAFTKVGAERRRRGVLLAFDRQPGFDFGLPAAIRPTAPAEQVLPWPSSPGLDGLPDPGSSPRF